MASWEELREFMHSNWSVRDLDERHLQLVFELPSRRAQTVLIEHASNDETDWVKFKSPIGELTEIDLWTAGEKLAQKVVGGLIVEDEYVVVTNALPLSSLGGNEVVETMMRVTMIADELGAALGTESP
ncbi:hypothetical protein SAMN02745244_02007 [Tessaracoccus bendigoensis DSM 12906]|uniref:Sensory transduction regulator n=1 Tax=Tessaracoccus bendigoensis DSM 12906 TaxID=1123357 RepID=A0A1M6HL86_9ACTN|nr:hypothetical protein [Tessaracoccus bendigoensis]SHJ22940.1 hypothetical protein SAMN02745244_02007 [Tessaracoccus bendigoensis DSM 12906]